ncbi:hypothetical protein B0H12DRAFT_1155773 [Mycena haematopus]|nr:hypothetical protein B0H12DRAFT_1158012 [Mycena haematopus]KAJ7213728.1 hypothetical protein B0H12DRAFT_1155773 [Mycena haematopus]
MYIGLYSQDGCEARHRRQSSCEYFSSSSRLFTPALDLASSGLAPCKPTIFSISLVLFDCL